MLLLLLLLLLRSADCLPPITAGPPRGPRRGHDAHAELAECVWAVNVWPEHVDAVVAKARANFFRACATVVQTHPRKPRATGAQTPLTRLATATETCPTHETAYFAAGVTTRALSSCVTNATHRSTRRACALRGLSYATSFVPLAAAHAITGSVTVQVTGQTTHLAALRTASLEAKEAPVCRADVAQIMCLLCACTLRSPRFFGGGSVGVERPKPSAWVVLWGVERPKTNAFFKTRPGD